VAERGANGLLDWAIAARPIPGESVSGDQCVVQVNETEMLLAVVDGLGHGPEAAAAARLAVEVLSENSAEPVEALLLLCHEHLANTRGAAVTIVSINPATASMSWLGVGNVEAALFRAAHTSHSCSSTRSPLVDMALLVGGIVGHQLPRLHPRDVDLEHGDLLVMATDGIARSFTEDVSALGAAPTLLADAILEDLARPTDDALVLVARYEADR
jgi:serine phosphatase RsbU (regulator of sigma subunit)